MIVNGLLKEMLAGNQLVGHFFLYHLLFIIFFISLHLEVPEAIWLPNLAFLYLLGTSLLDSFMTIFKNFYGYIGATLNPS